MLESIDEQNFRLQWQASLEQITKGYIPFGALFWALAAECRILDFLDEMSRSIDNAERLEVLMEYPPVRKWNDFPTSSVVRRGSLHCTKTPSSILAVQNWTPSRASWRDEDSLFHVGSRLQCLLGVSYLFQVHAQGIRQYLLILPYQVCSRTALLAVSNWQLSRHSRSTRTNNPKAL